MGTRLDALADPAAHNTPISTHATIAESHRRLPAAPRHSFAEPVIVTPFAGFITAHRITGRDHRASWTPPDAPPDIPADSGQRPWSGTASPSPAERASRLGHATRTWHSRLDVRTCSGCPLGGASGRRETGSWPVSANKHAHRPSGGRFVPVARSGLSCKKASYNHSQRFRHGDVLSAASSCGAADAPTADAGARDAPAGDADIVRDPTLPGPRLAGDRSGRGGGGRGRARDRARLREGEHRTR
jgi:hypothetical protein